MSSLIGFEIKKFFNRKKNLLSILLFIILTIVFIVLNINLEKNLKKSEKTSIDFQIESIEDALLKVKSEMINLPDNEKLKKINNSYEEELNILKDMKSTYESNDFNGYLRSKVQLDKKLLVDIKRGEIISPKNPDEIRDRIDINTILLNKNIKPIYSQASMEGFNFIKLFLNSPISIIIIIFIIILTADVMSSEFDSNTYKLLFTQPISKTKILLSKIIATAIIINVVILGLISIFFIILGVINGFGSIDYPIQFYNNNIEYISIGKFIALEIIFLITIINFICILSLIISSFSKSNSNSISVAIITTVSLYMISSKVSIGGLIYLNPFIYFDISNILQGNLANLYENFNINFKYGLIVIISSTIILLIINIIFFKKSTLSLNKK